MEYLTELTVSKLNANTEDACILTKRPDHVALTFTYVQRNNTKLKFAILNAVNKLIREVQGQGDDYFINTFAVTRYIGCAAAEFKAKNMTIDDNGEEVYIYGVHCIYDTNGEFIDADYSSDDICNPVPIANAIIKPRKIPEIPSRVSSAPINTGYIQVLLAISGFLIMFC